VSVADSGKPGTLSVFGLSWRAAPTASILNSQNNLPGTMVSAFGRDLGNPKYASMVLVSIGYQDKRRF
jgi:hypothetical protein